MKIVYIYPTLSTIGGADRIIVNKANFFALHYDYDVTIITAQQFDAPTFFPLCAKVKHIDLGVDFNKQYNLPVIKRIFAYRNLIRKYKQKLTALLVEIEADIVITTISRDIDFLHTIKDKSIKIAESHTSKDFIRNIHILAEKGFVYQLIANIWRRKIHDAIKNYDHLVVLTEKEKQKWSEVNQISVIPNSLFIPASQRSTNGSKKVISVGRLEKGKGFDLLIRAWKIVVQNRPDWEIKVYGDGPERNNLESLIAEYNLQHSFVLEQPVKNITDKYLDSSIYVMSSRFEGFGMVLIEAMACGIPVIAFDCPTGPSAIITNEEDGFLIPNEDIDHLAERILYLIDNKNVREIMGKRARENVMRFEEKKIMQTWSDLFSKLVAEKMLNQQQRK